MKTKNITTLSLLNALATLVYIGLVSALIKNGQVIFGNVQGYIAPFGFLMLFVVSAAICGYLVFGKPVLYYLNDQKKEALNLLGYTILWLALATTATLLYMVVV